MKRKRESASGRWSERENGKGRENGRENETERESAGGNAVLILTISVYKYEM